MSDTLTDLDRAVLRLAHYELQYHGLRAAARAVVNSRRPFSQHQSAVLTATLDALKAASDAETPGIDYRK